MLKAEAHLAKYLRPLIQDATPGLCLQAYVKGRKAVDLQVGKTWERYDLASLTKVIATTSILMGLVDQKKLKLTDPVRRYLPYLAIQKTVIEFLNHSAGLEWWVPLFQEIPEGISFETRRLYLRRRLAGLKFEPKERSVYSDPDFWVLGEVAEKLMGKPIDFIFSDLMQAWGIQDLEYHRDNQPTHAKSKYAPTEDCPWRKRILQGEVHDENAWALGGVAAHAGLFGTVQSVADWALAYRQAFLKGTGFLSSSTARKFGARSLPAERGDWALGFMMPSLTGSSAGEKMSKQSIGHTGFVGTSIWWDPKSDLLVVILSNRVNPTRENSKFVKLRPVIHDAIYSELFEGGLGV